jgi:radical SAM protein with 4Fe4S-binding SPASM domain
MIKARGRRYDSASAVWELTLKCNMRCLHCGSSAGKARPDELTTEESVKLCRDLTKISCKGVALIGGEVFLRDDWFEIAEEVKRQKMKLSIISNGFIIDERMASKISRLDPDVVGISIDGSNAGTHDYIRRTKGSYSRAVNAATLLKKKNLSVTIITSVHKLNFKELPEIRNMILKKDIAWQIQMAAPFGRFRKEYMLTPMEFYSVGLFISSLRKKFNLNDLPVGGAHDFGYFSSVLPYPRRGDWSGCQAGITNLGIQSNGNIKGCLALSDDFIEGNVKDRDIVGLWNDADSFSYNRQFKTSSLSGFCRDCPYSRVCKGGCLSVAYAVGKRREDPYCFYRIERGMRKD